MSKYNFTYKITNLINNDFYFGVHCTDNLCDNYFGSGKLLKYSIKKYGIENFIMDILCFFNTKKDAYNFEGYIVDEKMIKNKKCLNLSTGGYGGSAKGRKIKDTSNYKKRIFTEERNKNISNSLKGIKHSKEWSDKVNKANTGKSYPERNKKHSECMKGRVPWNKGKTFEYKHRPSRIGKATWNKGQTKETNLSLQKLSESMKGNKNSVKCI